MAKKLWRYKWILFDGPKPHKEYMEFHRHPEPERLARKKGYDVDEKLKKLYARMALYTLLYFACVNLFTYF